MLKTIQKHSIKLMALGICFSACKKDPIPEQIPKNETELITTVIIQTSDSATGETKYCKFQDKDGEGGNPPTQFDSLTFQNKHRYYVHILLLDESKAETDTVSKEVYAEAENHLFQFVPKDLNLNIQVTDQDKNGLALGLNSIWNCGNSSRGNVQIKLKHQVGIKNGDPNLGETDLDVNFTTVIR